MIIAFISYQKLLIVISYLAAVCSASFNSSSLLGDYERYHRPVPKENSTEPVVVDLKMEITNFGQFDTEKMKFEITLVLWQTWFEPRLNTQHLKKKIVLNYLKDLLWIPDLYFPNSIKGKLGEVTSPNFLIWLEPTGYIKYCQRITVEIACIMKLWQYPMDEQVCSIEMSSFGYPADELVLRWMHEESAVHKNVMFSENVYLNEFTIEKVKTTNNTKCGNSMFGEFSCLQVKIYLQRNLEYYMVHTYVPNILIVTISWLSFMIDFTSAPGRISLGLLSILTLITQSSSMIANRPKISYIKAIDIWVFTCLAFVTSALLEFSFINACCREGPKPLFSLTRRWAQASAKKMTITTGIKLKAAKGNPDDDNSLDPFADNEFSDTNETKVKGIASSFAMEKSTGYKIDGVFFVVYPLAFLIFNIIYWSYYYRHYEFE